MLQRKKKTGDTVVKERPARTWREQMAALLPLTWRALPNSEATILTLHNHNTTSSTHHGWLSPAIITNQHITRAIFIHFLRPLHLSAIHHVHQSPYQTLYLQTRPATSIRTTETMRKSPEPPFQNSLRAYEAKGGIWRPILQDLLSCPG